MVICKWHCRLEYMLVHYSMCICVSIPVQVLFANTVSVSHPGRYWRVGLFVHHLHVYRRGNMLVCHLLKVFTVTLPLPPIFHMHSWCILKMTIVQNRIPLTLAVDCSHLQLTVLAFVRNQTTSALRKFIA